MSVFEYVMTIPVIDTIATHLLYLRFKFVLNIAFLNSKTVIIYFEVVFDKVAQ